MYIQKMKNICIFANEINMQVNLYLCGCEQWTRKEKGGKEEVTSAKLFNISWVFCGVFSTLIIVCYI